jgi:DNA-binding transcriptional MerR regulator
LIAPEGRRGGKRVYGEEAIERMALILFAKEIGLSLDEIRKLLSGFPDETTAGDRWRELAAAKLTELDAMALRIETMRNALQRISRCGCHDLDQCARGIATKHCR